METTPPRIGWLPRQNPDLRPYFNVLQQPGSLINGTESVEALDREAWQNAGYHGRVGALEIWQKAESDHHLILNRVDERSHLLKRVWKTAPDEGVEKFRDGATFRLALQQMGAHIGSPPMQPKRRHQAACCSELNKLPSTTHHSEMKAV